MSKKDKSRVVSFKMKESLLRDTRKIAIGYYTDGSENVLSRYIREAIVEKNNKIKRRKNE